MKKFQYQILQFCPDKVTGEFLNVGIVVFDPQGRELVFRILNKVGAIGQLFNRTNTRYLLKQLNTIHRSLDKIRRSLAEDKFQFAKYTSVDELTRQAFVRDDSALFFSEVCHSLDISITHLANYLGDRMLTIGEAEVDRDIKSDKEVWTKMFKQYFDKLNVSTYLTPRTIKTKYDEISFEHTWKNGYVNFFEAVNFDLQKDDTIKNKVRRWAGQIDELKTAEENLNLYLLANMPVENAQMQDYISSFLTDKSSSLVRVEIITPSEADQLVVSIKDKIFNHN